MQKILSYIMKFGLGAFIAFLIFESSMHIIASTQLGKIFPVIEPELGQPDIDIGYAFKPDNKVLWPRENRAFVQINSQGLRDNEIQKNKNPETLRIALSGDSVVEALQVENQFTFDALAEQSFKNEDKNIEILNFGMSGNGPLRQLVRLEKFAAPLDIDMTVMLMSASDFLTTELQDDSGNPAYTINSNGTIKRGYTYRNRFSQRHATDIIGRTFMFLMHHSHTFRMLYYKKSQDPLKIMGLNLGRQKPVSQQLDLCRPDDFKNLHKFWVTPDEKSSNWKITQHYFNEVSTYASGNKMPLIIGFYIPIPEGSCDRQNAQRAEIVNAIKKITKPYQIQFVDWNKQLIKVLEPSSHISILYGFGTRLGSGHLNYKGHEIFALVLQETVKQNMIIKLKPKTL